jgi:2-polyprenyl-3-methyl-5-hydroxy-6-metoxy-1,4-benzoquinol methylase
MKFISNGKKFFNEIDLEVNQDGKKWEFDFRTPFRFKKKGLQKKPFDFKISIDGEEQENEGVPCFGQDALWLPLDDGTGIKIIRTADNQQKICQNLEYIQDLYSDIFPEIEWFSEASIGEVPCVVVKMETISGGKDTYRPVSFLSPADNAMAGDMMPASLETITYCIRQFIDNELSPEDSWYKNGGFTTENIINGKIVDFHAFEYSPQRFSMPANGPATLERCNEIFHNALRRYAEWSIKRGEALPKWKGKIYQGMKFDNGFELPGYSSDNRFYDSYVKSLFMPLDKVGGGKVLDLGSNQGFFSFQSALAGAEEVTGVELTEEDVLLADEIRQEILGLDNVKFVNGDLVKYLEEDQDWYELIIMSSVLHQTHPDLYNCDDFLRTLASKCRRFFFETPVGHKHYDFSLKQITEKLQQHFNTVRLVYFYDAYSTGFRAVYVCHPLDPGYNDPGEYEKALREGRVGKG